MVGNGDRPRFRPQIRIKTVVCPLFPCSAPQAVLAPRHKPHGNQNEEYARREYQRGKEIGRGPDENIYAVHSIGKEHARGCNAQHKIDLIAILVANVMQRCSGNAKLRGYTESVRQTR